jgi:hypothetical protein
MVQPSIHDSTCGKAARDANGPQGVQAVDVLNDLRFQGAWRDASAEAVRFDGVGDGRNQVVGVSNAPQEATGLQRGQGWTFPAVLAH